jgi:hypothetical protein
MSALPRLWVDDATPEKIAILLAENGERIAVMSAEGGIFDIIAGRYTDGSANVDVFLKGHAGDDLRVDRVARGAVVLSRPALTVALAVQPSVMHGVLATPTFRGRGLPARFLFAVPRNTIGTRDVDAPDVDAATANEYARALRTILDRPMPAEPALAAFSRTAWAAFREWNTEHERQLADGGPLELLRDWGSKLPGAIARIAGIFHVLADDDGDTIDLAHVERALALAPYLVAHAQIAHSVMGADPATAAAEAILRHLREHPCSSFTKRDLHGRMRARFEKSADLDAPLRLLVEHGHLRRDDPPYAGVGRKPSPIYSVHPQLRGERARVAGDWRAANDAIFDAAQKTVVSV